MFHIVDPLKLSLEKEYNLNIVKEIKVKTSYSTLDKSITECQNKESFNDCKTRLYLETLIQLCGCLPFNIRLSKKVI